MRVCRLIPFNSASITVRLSAASLAGGSSKGLCSASTILSQATSNLRRGPGRQEASIVTL